MITCITGDTQDLSAVYLGWAARRSGHRVLLLDEAALGVSWSFGFDERPGAGGALEHDGETVGFAELAGVFARFDPEPALPPNVDFDALTAERFRAERRAGLHELLDHLPCPVANRPSGGRSNGSKALQMALLERAGFRVPRWLVTNEPQRVRSFLAELGGPAIYKAVSGLRSRVRMVDGAALARFEAGTSPVVVQDYVAGLDVRVHTIDSVCHGTAVSGTGVDYRFDGSRDYRPQTVPTDIADRCRSVAAAEGLLLAGFDFRVDASGAWHCLEVNPMPSFIPYQWATGQPIAETVLAVFAEHARSAPAIGQ